jgi:hypothetical protein
MTESPSFSIIPDTVHTPEMTPFVRIRREASAAMLQRKGLLALPTEFFAKFFGGRLPTLEEKLFWIERSIIAMTELNVYQNNIYEVSVVNGSPFIRLSIRRHDLQPCKEWKHFQQIKNALIGPDHEAVELFPSESRLIDTNNEYHLWVHSEPAYRFPLGFFQERVVLDEPVTFQETRGLNAG